MNLLRSLFDHEYKEMRRFTKLADEIEALDEEMQQLSDEQLKEMLTFANAAASIITTRKGALRVMPTREEVLDFLKKQEA